MLWPSPLRESWMRFPWGDIEWFSTFMRSLFPFSSLCFRRGLKASHALSCPSLNIYVDHTCLWRHSPQLLVCFGAGRRGLATSKHRISHWVRDAISLAFEVHVFLHLSAFGRILLGAWLPLKLFSGVSP